MARVGEAETAVSALRGGLQGAKLLLDARRKKLKAPANAQEYIDKLDEKCVGLTSQLKELRVVLRFITSHVTVFFIDEPGGHGQFIAILKSAKGASGGDDHQYSSP